jgi:hypothetical protein
MRNLLSRLRIAMLNAQDVDSFFKKLASRCRQTAELRNPRNEVQGLRIAKQLTQAPLNEVLYDFPCPRRPELLGKITGSVLAGERPEVKFQWLIGVLLTNSSNASRAVPVCHSTGEDKARVAEPSQLTKDLVNCEAVLLGTYLVECVNNQNIGFSK